LLAGTAATLAVGAGLGRARAQAQTASAWPVRVGLLHPVSGPLAYSGAQARAGAEIAVEEINRAGGIRALGGARIEALLADARSSPEAAAAEVDRLAEAGAVAIIGPYSSAIAMATTAAAARHGIPHLVDVGIADEVVSRGLANTFRFGPGFSKIVEAGADYLGRLNEAAGKPARTVLIVHEDSDFGTTMARKLSALLPEQGFEIVATMAHGTPHYDFSAVIAKIQALRPDVLIPANYYDEFVLLARALQWGQAPVKGIYSVLGGGASSLRFIRQYPQAAEHLMDCNHWVDPRSAAAFRLREKVEIAGRFFTYEVFLNYACVMLLADALEHAGRPEREAVTAALGASTWAGHFMPYGPTRFVDGQNQGAQPAVTQVQDRALKVVYPFPFASAGLVVPAPGR
jgi:branched-chain amino acid transport system substrate-binding protein